MMLSFRIPHSFGLKILEITQISLSVQPNLLLGVLIEIVPIQFVIDEFCFVFYLFPSSISFSSPVGGGAGGVGFRGGHVAGEVEEISEFLVIGDHHFIPAC
jgi:hypothetical protein